ncbi:1-acyl-sn-glycerol-3-phosphate acyltransferase [Oscillatoria sp. CS-180]|uniref:1-acyl-sn-glycerol-3-phosphate acyltransferase n=1 Tax=Oscillatoria sp. CS-180 TaxID=3021720 RepID=UPI00232D6D0D|nr:1-acyl-sn-glycerol-3-phosphate acyltransferase [Oscillatoria sp. CS-180]MDB9528328.1 1-acyl-sn-glycerol-3-phosphate acyltransferase [Oscillatoria sp. CS-180]
MTNTLRHAQPPLDFLPPAFDAKVLWLTKTLLPTWMHWRSSVQQLNIQGAEILVDLFHQFHAGKARFLIAFRHPSPNDAYCLMNLLWNELPKTAHRLGQPFSQVPHVHFIYDRGIPLWAGKWVGWFYSHLGGTSIQRGKVDRQGLKSARHLFANGQFPMAAAPEGANNGHTGIISPFEPGIAQFGFWCVDDLRKADRPEQVFIVPLGIQYRYRDAPWPALATLMTALEQEVGITPETTTHPTFQDDPAAIAQALYPRLVRLGYQLLEIMESYYSDFFQIAFDPPDAQPDAQPTELGFRLNRLLNAALQAAESFFHIQPKGSVIDRCRKIEQAGWDWIYREDLRTNHQLSTVERGLADRIAEEAELRMWHMRLVENFVAVTGNYVSEKPTVERFAETLLLLRDTIVLIKGENPFPRPALGDQIACLSVGEALSVSDRWPAYKANRRQAISDLTADLQSSVQALIDSTPSSQPNTP